MQITDKLVLDHRAIQEGIRRGWCIADYCEKYEIDAIEFDQEVRRLYPHDYEKMMNKIAKAGKRRAKSRKPADVTKTMKYLIEAPKTPRVKLGEKEEPEVEETEVIREELPKPETVEERMERLEKREAEQQDIVIKAEIQRKKLVSERYEKNKELCKIRDKLAEIEQEFREKSEEYEKIAEEGNELVAQINEISEKIREDKRELDETRVEIENLRTITLEVYSDGGVGVKSQLEANLDDSRAEEVLLELVRLPGAQVFMVCELLSLAKAIAMKEATERSIEMIFENDEIEKLYMELQEAKIPRRAEVSSEIEVQPRGEATQEVAKAA